MTPADPRGNKGPNDVNLRFSDTFIRACTSLPALLPPGFVGSGSSYSKRGIYLADATVDSDTIDFPIEVFCYDESDIAVPVNASLVNTLERTQEGGGGEDDVLIMSGPLLPKPDKTVRFYRESTPIRTWGGMYRGVDPLDGGKITLDIARAQEDGQYDLRFSDTFIRACTKRPSGVLPEGFEGAGPSYSKRGLYLAKAMAENDTATSLVSLDGDLEVPITIYCFSGPDDEEQPWTLYNASVMWTFYRAGDVLIMSGDLFAGETEKPGGYQNMRFHHISGHGTASEERDFDSTSDSRTLRHSQFAAACWLALFSAIILT